MSYEHAGQVLSLNRNPASTVWLTHPPALQDPAALPCTHSVTVAEPALAHLHMQAD